MAKLFSGIVKVTLDSPMEWEGETLNCVELNFGKMNGNIATDAERKVNSTGNFHFVPALNADYCLHVAAGISGLPDRVFKKMGYGDFDAIRQTVGAYLGRKDPQKFYDKFVAGDGEDEDDEDEDEGDSKGEGDEEDFTAPAR